MGHNFLNTAWIFTKILLDIDIDGFSSNIVRFIHDSLILVLFSMFEWLFPNIASMPLVPLWVPTISSNELGWKSPDFSLISWSFFTIFFLKIALISTFKMPPRLLSNLLKALSNLSGKIRIFWKMKNRDHPHYVCMMSSAGGGHIENSCQLTNKNEHHSLNIKYLSLIFFLQIDNNGPYMQ